MLGHFLHPFSSQNLSVLYIIVFKLFIIIKLTYQYTFGIVFEQYRLKDIENNCLQEVNMKKTILILTALLVMAVTACGKHASGGPDPVKLSLSEGQVTTVADIIYALPAHQLIHSRFGNTTARDFFYQLNMNSHKYTPPLYDTTLVVVDNRGDNTYIVRPYKSYEYVTDRLFWFQLTELMEK